MTLIPENLYQHNKEEFQIYEGLTRTTPLYTTEKILKRKGFIINHNYNKNTFSLRFQFYENYEKAEYQLNKILVLCNNLGWFPSNFSSMDNKFKGAIWNIDNFKTFISNNYLDILFIFEAKYDILIEKIPKILYHVCNTKSVDKILEFGLSPKSRSSLAFHPDRVFLALNYESAYKYAFHKFKLDYEKKSILEINISRSPKP